jgi:hypothetical protein
MSTELITIHTEDIDTAETTPLTVTLEDLIAAVQDSVEPGEEDLVVPTLIHLFQTQRVTWQTPPTRPYKQLNHEPQTSYNILLRNEL